MLAPWQTARGRTRAIALLLAVASLGVVAAGSAMAHHKPHSPRSPVKVPAEASSPRVNSIDLRGQSVVVTGVATRPGAEVTRTLWYETVEGAGFAAEHDGATTLTRRVLDGSGKLLSSETDPVQTGDPEAHAPVRLSEADVTRGAQARAAALGVTIVATHYVPLFGGTAELVVQPSDPTSFAQTAGAATAKLLGPLAHDNGAYLITIVDATQTPLLVLGYTPGVGGGTGQGIGWQAPDVHSDAIWGPHVASATPPATNVLAAPATQARKIVVPHVLARTLDVTIRKVHAAGLRPVAVSLPQIFRGDLSVNGYGAVSQRPRAGSLVPVGARVLLRIGISVNGGPGGIARHRPVKVPDVIGLNIQKAIREVLEAGLTVTVPRVEHRLTSFTVRRQGLKPGHTVRAGTVITLVVAG